MWICKKELVINECTQQITRQRNGDVKRDKPNIFIPISHLPAELQDAVGSAYLCMRAIDEIEDHPELEAGVKSRLLYAISDLLKSLLTKTSTWH